MKDVAVTNSNIKCSFASLYSNKLIEDEYMINLCKTSILEVKTFKERVREKYLHSFLLNNMKFFISIDNCGNEVSSCDINKIYNLK